MKRGDHVRIVDGPFAGLAGILDRSATSPKQRVWVLLSVFDRLTRVEVLAREVWRQSMDERPERCAT